MRADRREEFRECYGCLVRRTILPDEEYYEHRCLGSDYERIAATVDGLGRARFHIRAIRERTGLPWTPVETALSFMEHVGVITPVLFGRYRATSLVTFSSAMAHFGSLSAQSEDRR